MPVGSLCYLLLFVVERYFDVGQSRLVYRAIPVCRFIDIASAGNHITRISSRDQVLFKPKFQRDNETRGATSCQTNKHYLLFYYLLIINYFLGVG